MGVKCSRAWSVGCAVPRAGLCPRLNHSLKDVCSGCSELGGGGVSGPLNPSARGSRAMLTTPKTRAQSSRSAAGLGLCPQTYLKGVLEIQLQEGKV